MAMNDGDLDAREELELRQSLVYAVGSICEEHAQRMQQDGAVPRRHRPAPSKETLTILADLVHQEMEVMATELQHFAQHGNRKVIKPEDVLLMARKDPAMVRMLRQYQRERLPPSATRKRRRLANTDEEY